jgi:hypothetical protein
MTDLKKMSPHLFWDTDVNILDLKKHKQFIVQRVLEYGLLSDWLMLNKYFTIKEIARIATKISGLDKRAASFVASIANVSIKNFKCYTIKQSTTEHWSL